MNCPKAASPPALKIVSSVRHTEPPAPFVCAAAETSEWNAAGGAMTTWCAVALDEAAFRAVSATV